MEAVAETAGKAPALRRRLERGSLLGALMIAPAVVFIIVLVGGPLILAIYVSFTDATAGSLSDTAKAMNLLATSFSTGAYTATFTPASPYPSTRR